MHDLIPRETLERIRRSLLDRQRALFDDMDGLEDDLRVIEENREAELEARAQGEAMARLLDRVRERDRHELEEIHRALAKIPAGVFGPCERCRGPIPVARLLALPEARHCRGCAEELESAPAAPPRPFAPGSHRRPPVDARDLDDEELAEAVRERILAHGDPDLLRVDVRCHGGVARLSGEIPSEAQRQVLVQIVADGLGLDVIDRLRVMGLDREGARRGAGPAGEEPSPPLEERLQAGRGMHPLPADRWQVPDDEGEPSETAPDSPIPEEE